MVGWWYVTIIGTTIAVANMILSSSSRPSLTSPSSSSQWLACGRARDQFRKRAKSFHWGRAPRRWQSWSPPRAPSPGSGRRGQGRENYEDTYIKHTEAQNGLKRWMIIRLAIGNLLCAQVVADKPARAVRDHLWKNNQWRASASCSQVPLVQIWRLCLSTQGSAHLEKAITENKSGAGDGQVHGLLIGRDNNRVVHLRIPSSLLLYHQHLVVLTSASNKIIKMIVMIGKQNGPFDRQGPLRGGGNHRIFIMVYWVFL